MIARVGILGGGAWGTALALTAARAGREVTLWARDAATVTALKQGNGNPRYLPGVALDTAFAATADIAEAATADVLILAVPAQTVRAVGMLAAPHVARGTPVVIAAKGLEHDSDRRLSEVVAATIPHAAGAVLSGPSFAADVARGLPTAVTVAAEDEALALDLCHALANPAFRPYAETDVIGVEIGGAVKNVLAIAAGIVAGRRLGASAQAALIARGFAELRRLGEAMGARPETLMGLSGLGDLVLTASSRQSRNYSFGIALGEGDMSAPRALVEGRTTAPVARDLAARAGIDMPIATAIAEIVEGKLTVDAAIDGIMARPLKREAG